MDAQVKRKLLIFSVLILFIFVIGLFGSMGNAYAADRSQPATKQLSWNDWVKELRSQAIAEGISPQVFDDAFKGLRPDRRTLNLEKSQPEKRLTYLKYRNSRGSKYRIHLGKQMYKKHGDTLNAVGQSYGVDPCYILSFWGLESAYGTYMGNFPVIKSLATLAYKSHTPKRQKFFRNELILALGILQEGHVTNNNFKGEWAGASGHPQFLPSSWRKFAVDYNQDGNKDIWRTKEDAFASIANYLVGNGWETGGQWGVQVNMPRGMDESLLGYKTHKTVADWQAMGVHPVNGQSFPAADKRAYLIEPYGGPAYLVFNNFRVIMRYNNSTFYAGTVAYIADSICQRR